MPILCAVGFLLLTDISHQFDSPIDTALKTQAGWQPLHLPFVPAHYEAAPSSPSLLPLIERQMQALEKVGLTESRIRMALDGSGPLVIYDLTEEGRKLYSPERGLQFADLRLERVIDWEYFGIPTVSNTFIIPGKLSRKVIYYTYRDDTPVYARFTWNVTRIHPWAQDAAAQQAFPLLRQILSGEKQEEHIALLERTGKHLSIQGISPWITPDSSLISKPTELFLLLSNAEIDPYLSLLLTRDALRKSKVPLTRNTPPGYMPKIVDALNIYLAEYSGFLQLDPQSPDTRIFREKSILYSEPKWEEAEPEDSFARQRAKEEERLALEAPDLARMTGNLKDLSRVQQAASRMNQTLMEQRNPLLTSPTTPSLPVKRPLKFDAQYPALTRFALFRLGKILKAGQVYTLKEEPGWLYCDITFTYRVAQRADWLDDPALSNLFPHVQPLLRDAEITPLTWQIR